MQAGPKDSADRAPVDELAVTNERHLVLIRQELDQAGEMVTRDGGVRRVAGVDRRHKRNAGRTVQREAVDELLEVWTVVFGVPARGLRLGVDLVRALERHRRRVVVHGERPWFTLFCQVRATKLRQDRVRPGLVEVVQRLGQARVVEGVRWNALAEQHVGVEPRKPLIHAIQRRTSAEDIQDQRQQALRVRDAVERMRRALGLDALEQPELVDDGANERKVGDRPREDIEVGRERCHGRDPGAGGPSAGRAADRGPEEGRSDHPLESRCPLRATPHGRADRRERSNNAGHGRTYKIARCPPPTPGIGVKRLTHSVVAERVVTSGRDWHRTDQRPVHG